MGKIIILDENTANKIAAGEIIERPSSLVKELVENSIDAGASSINVEIRNGGISYIKISDNGSGIYEDDAEIAFERHATSKIRNSKDLDAISTLGFRGEALASIAAVSSLELSTRVRESNYGTYLKIEGGQIKEIKQIGCPVGTTFTIKNLFYNTPARFKFLKKDSTEAGYVSDIISRIALGKPNVSFKLISSGATIINTPGNNDLLSTIFSVYGKDVAKSMLEIKYRTEKISIYGYAGLPEIARSNRNYQSYYINGRYIKSKIITAAIDEAYKTLLMKNKYPFIVINISLIPAFADINVHPSKMEVKFSDEQEIFRDIYHAVESSLLQGQTVKSLKIEEKQPNPFMFGASEASSKQYVQQKISYKGNESDIKSKDSNLNNKVSNFNIEQYSTNTNYDSKNSNIFNSSIDSEINNIVSESSKISEQNYFKSEIKTTKPSLYDTPLFEGFIPIAQLFSTYIIFEKENEIVLIDQHAAHERLIYEELIYRYDKKKIDSQLLLSPVVLDLTYQEILFVEEEKDFFLKLGFTYEDFGNNSIIIRSIPVNDIELEVKEVFLSIIDTAINSIKAGYEKAADEIMYSIACKSAVKANKKLDLREMQELLNSLGKLSNPYTCPHGRPTVLYLKRYELEKMFKRIV